MRRTVTIQILLVVAAGLFARPAFAQEEEDIDLTDEFAFLEEDKVVEAAARHKQDIGMSPSAITVVTRADIEATGASTLCDLLRIVPGMEVIAVSPSLYSVTSRLFWTNENNHYLVLVDGRDASVELLGQVPWGIQPLSLDDVERIEIIRGPASSLYGASAMGGVISITTRSVPEKTSAFARLAGGEAGVFQANARGSTRVGDFGFSVSGGYETFNSFFDPREPNKRVWNVRAVGEYRIDETRRLLLDVAVANGTGQMTTSVGPVNLDFGQRVLRLAYESEDVSARVFWTQVPVELNLNTKLEYGGIELAEFVPVTTDAHTIDTEVQWRLPTFWEPLLILVGAGGRASWIGSDQLLEGTTYADPNSDRYHEPGVSDWEVRGGVFVHSELEPADWITISASLRFDGNTVTAWFLSPRLAAVFQPAEGHFVRAGVARAFRKPAYVETKLHPLVDFPADSPITGLQRERFLEFASTMIGNEDVENETLLSFEAGYLGRFLDDRLTVTLDLYYNQLRNLMEVKTEMVRGEQGLPDLDRSKVALGVIGDFDILGAELGIRFAWTESVLLQASWAHRQVYDHQAGSFTNENPKNLITVGGRFGTDLGLVGSLYLFSRSEFTDVNVEGPEGLLSPRLSLGMDNVMLVMARLGWRWRLGEGTGVEAGAKLFLPFSPFSGELFRYYEEGGGVTADGNPYGGEQLRRMLSFYIQGNF